jgi:flagellar biosynthesis/type III secretory pathway protein FliH
MTRVLRAPGMAAPISVPGPGAWGPVAVAAHDQGYARGLVEGRAHGRHDLAHLHDELRQAVTSCLAAVEDARLALLGRVMDVAELMVVTVLRHQPDTTTAGLLVRVREALDGLDPGQVELTVHPDLVASVRELLADQTVALDVGADASLARGEFRIATEWASADATWQHYIDAAREAVAMHVAALGHAES